MSVPLFPIIPPFFNTLYIQRNTTHEHAEIVLYISPRVYIQNMGNGNTFREQKQKLIRKGFYYED